MENQFKAGDLVWAKVYQHPWWPCIIYHEALTSTEIQQTKKEGFVLVSFFGDSSYKWLGPKSLLPFESKYCLFSKRSKSRLFVKAVNEAVDEVIYRAALGLTCPCSFFSRYRPSSVEGLQEVDIDGYQLGGIFTVQQIEQYRQEFQPVETVSFLQQLALDSDVHQDLNHSKEVARILTFRKANYAEVDEPYFNAFGVDPRRPKDPIVVSDEQKTHLIQASTDQPSEAVSQDKKKAKVKHQNKNKRSLMARKVKLHGTKKIWPVKKNKHVVSSSELSPDHLPKKMKRSKVEVDKKQDKIEPSPSPPKEPSMSREDDKKLKSSATTKVSNDVDFVPEDESSETTAPFKTSKKGSSPASKPLKKRKRSSANTREVQERPLTISPQTKGKKVNNSEKVKKHEEGPKMMLSITFPRGATLPSVSELKAKLVRFGPLDTSSIHVSWYKSRCKVVFMNKSNAEEAYKQAVNFKKLFVPDVTYNLHPVVSRPNIQENSEPGRNIRSNLHHMEAPVASSASSYVQEAYKQAFNFKKLFVPDVTYKSHPVVSRPNLHENSVQGRNIGGNLHHEEAPVASSTSAYVKEAYKQAVNFKKSYVPDVTYKLHPAVSRPNLHENIVQGRNAGSNLHHEEAPVASFTSAFAHPILLRYQEIYARYREEADKTPVQVKTGGVDISQPMLHLLNECKRIVQESKSL